MRKLDTAALREHLEDGRTWTGLGLVSDDDGNGHFEIDESDVLVEVTLVPSGVSIQCRLAAVAGGPGAGVWRIPPLGAEVAVMIPDGEVENGGIIVGVLSTGELPEGVSEATTLIIGTTIEARAKDGTAVALATKEDIDDLASHIDTHTHGGVMSGVAFTTAPADATGPQISPQADGTEVFKGQ